LGDEVASYLRDLIMSGQVRGGEYVRMDHVANHLGVSATPVREALLSLRAEGFVTLEPRRGFVVLPISGADVRDLFYAQATLSGELAARAAAMIDDAVLARLRSMQTRLNEATKADDTASIELENYRFHREINLLASSPKLGWLLGMVVRYSPRRFYANIEGWPKASNDDHEAILSALEKRDALLAKKAMESHIVHAGDLLAEFLDSLDMTGPRKSIFDV
jgi:DNA-binding GntR family transcriptional regulator